MGGCTFVNSGDQLNQVRLTEDSVVTLFADKLQECVYTNRWTDNWYPPDPADPQGLEGRERVTAQLERLPNQTPLDSYINAKNLFGQVRDSRPSLQSDTPSSCWGYQAGAHISRLNLLGNDSQ